MSNKSSNKSSDKSSNESVSLGSNDTDESYSPSDGSLGSLDEFIVNDDDMDSDTRKELDDEIDRLRTPKLYLNPYPTLNPDPNSKSNMPSDITDEKERIKWLITNKLGHNMTLDDYVKYLEEQEQEVLNNYNRRMEYRETKRRKLNNDKPDKDYKKK